MLFIVTGTYIDSCWTRVATWTWCSHVSILSDLSWVTVRSSSSLQAKLWWRYISEWGCTKIYRIKKKWRSSVDSWMHVYQSLRCPQRSFTFHEINKTYRMSKQSRCTRRALFSRHSLWERERGGGREREFVGQQKWILFHLLYLPEALGFPCLLVFQVVPTVEQTSLTDQYLCMQLQNSSLRSDFHPCSIHVPFVRQLLVLQQGQVAHEHPTYKHITCILLQQTKIIYLLVSLVHQVIQGYQGNLVLPVCIIIIN